MVAEVAPVTGATRNGATGAVRVRIDPDTAANVQAHIEAHGLSPELVERAVETLCDMLGWSSRRLEELEKRLADAVAAERIAANEQLSFSRAGMAHRSSRLKAGAARHLAALGCGLDPARPMGKGLLTWPARCAGR